MQFDSLKETAIALDKADDLSRFRKSFTIPKHTDNTESVYLCGNSLGLRPNKAVTYVNEELEDWARLGVKGHFDKEFAWTRYHEFLTESMATIVGAKHEEVVVMNTLTPNLHFMMVSFYQPEGKRRKIVMEADAFPSDTYAVASQIKFHGGNPDEDIIRWQPRPGENTLNIEDLQQILSQHGDEIALIMIGAVNYYTGQYFDLKKITEIGHSHGCMVGFDCAHAAGNVPLNLHDTGADFAVWCTYKYLNSGPGSIAGCFVHERHAHNERLPRFAGWWGHDKEERFLMKDQFKPIPGAEGWQQSNAPILSMAPIRASLELFMEAGFENLRAKSEHLTSYLEYLLNDLPGDRIKIITPSTVKDRGCQLSLAVKNADKSLFERISDKGVIADWREPDVIRVAPAPIYNSYMDCWNFTQILKSSL
ncbi:kynureninase [Nonlabens ponticola]|uniref:Kynureninase n=1 Tax=Nonlabens ponticola TaxID=2496866 RepID=A0A3S9MUA4_9FLAO|nr:kynureninase [Nonlabens ponticola]AZQ42759.1 kynureninase [Nonlabens ponticola]